MGWYRSFDFGLVAVASCWPGCSWYRYLPLHADAYLDSYRDFGGHSYENSNRNGDANGHRYCDAYLNTDRYCHGNGTADHNCNRDAGTYRTVANADCDSHVYSHWHIDGADADRDSHLKYHVRGSGTNGEL